MCPESQPDDLLNMSPSAKLELPLPIDTDIYGKPFKTFESTVNKLKDRLSLKLKPFTVVFESTDFDHVELTLRITENLTDSLSLALLQSHTSQKHLVEFLETVNSEVTTSHTKLALKKSMEKVGIRHVFSSLLLFCSVMFKFYLVVVCCFPESTSGRS